MKFYINAFLSISVFFFTTLSISTWNAHGKEVPDGPHVRNELSHQVRSLFQDAKFAELDDMADRYRVTKARFQDGQWKLSAFFTAFEQGINTPEWAFPKMISLAEQWRQSNPDSVTAQCVLAGIWKDYAWQARGAGYASEVKEQDWPLVRERLDKAWSIINTPPKPGVVDSPRRHNLRLNIAKTRGVEGKEYEILFSEAVQQAPDYYDHYVAKASYLLPKWHGNEGDWQRFITQIAKRNPGGEGATIYTRTAWSMFPSEWKDFKQSDISWDRMKAGFKEIDHHYQNSTWILNTFARFACRAGDFEAMRQLLKQIDSNNYYPEAWDKDKIEDCRMWADLGKTREVIETEKLAQNMKRFEEMVFENILELAEKGNTKVIGELAAIYQQGKVTPPDPVTAYAWLLQDTTTYEKQLAKSSKSLSPEQLRQAHDKAIAIRSKMSQHPK